MSGAEAGPSTSRTAEPSYTLHTAHAGSREPGTGALHLCASNPHARFSTLAATYPLKLLAPTPLPSQPRNLATCYTLAYGGGLVAGDVIRLKVDVDDHCGLVMLTQGSTKVFKHRPGIRPLSHQVIRTGPSAPLQGSDGARLTRQLLAVELGRDSLLLLLPDSVSPFRGSRYSQAQRFILPADRSASALILDWVNSGRGYRPPLQATTPAGLVMPSEDQEVWAMDSYASTNEVVLGDKTIMRERMVLDNDPGTTPAAATAATGAEELAAGLSAVAGRLAPYHVYGTLLIIGPHLAPLSAHLERMCDTTSQFQLAAPPGLVWAYSKTDLQGGVLRFAATEVEDARAWLREVLKLAEVDKLVGDGLWPRCI